MLPLHCDIQTFIEYAVAPYVGAWIETNLSIRFTLKIKSHPTWVRGLKPFEEHYVKLLIFVAPYVGAWIETLVQSA